MQLYSLSPPPLYSLLPDGGVLLSFLALLGASVFSSLKWVEEGPVEAFMG